jgi:hypothetical protein
MVVRYLGKMGGMVRRSWRQLLLAGSVAGLVGLAFCWGRSSAQTPAAAVPTGPSEVVIHKPGEMVAGAPVAMDTGSDYSRRVVAYIHKNIPITREDLGEYLIARYGPDKVEALVNRKIVDNACAARGIRITDVEVDTAFAEDLKGLGLVSAKDFDEKLLKPRHTTLYQWKEDVIRPKLALTQFCRGRVHVTEEDVQKAFVNRFGDKVRCRMIVLTRDPAQDRKNTELWTRISKNDAEGNAEFDKAARSQPIPALAARNGDVPPVSHYCGDDRIEKAAFSLSPGEVSALIETPDGTVIIKCIERIPAAKKDLTEADRETLRKEILDQKILEEIPKVLKELRDQAEPHYFIKKQTAEEMYGSVARDAGIVPPAPASRTH